MDEKRIAQIARVMQEEGLTRVRLEESDGTSVELERGAQATAQPAVAAPLAAAPAAQAAPAATPAAEPAPAEEPAGVTACTAVTSPMVGVFYAAPSPGAEPFAAVGAQVKKGETLCVIEAMKVMNEVVAEVDGEVIDVCVSDGQLVEFGSVLMKIREG